jgi:hypothetical protein
MATPTAPRRPRAPLPAVLGVQTTNALRRLATGINPTTEQARAILLETAADDTVADAISHIDRRLPGPTRAAVAGILEDATNAPTAPERIVVEAARCILHVLRPTAAIGTVRKIATEYSAGAEAGVVPDRIWRLLISEGLNPGERDNLAKERLGRQQQFAEAFPALWDDISSGNAPDAERPKELEAHRLALAALMAPCLAAELAPHYKVERSDGSIIRLGTRDAETIIRGGPFGEKMVVAIEGNVALPHPF